MTEPQFPINEEAYAEWLEYRKKEKKKPVGPMAEKKQRKLLSQYPADVQQEMIDTAISSGWQGLFPLKGGRQRPPTTRHTSLRDDLTDTTWSQ